MFGISNQCALKSLYQDDLFFQISPFMVVSSSIFCLSLLSTLTPQYPWGIHFRTHHGYQNLQMSKSQSQPSASAVLQLQIQPTTDHEVLQYLMKKKSEYKRTCAVQGSTLVEGAAAKFELTAPSELK